jgi:hypothetical protein
VESASKSRLSVWPREYHVRVRLSKTAEVGVVGVGMRPTEQQVTDVHAHLIKTATKARQRASSQDRFGLCAWAGLLQVKGSQLEYRVLQELAGTDYGKTPVQVTD